MLGIGDVGLDRSDRLAQVVRRDVGRHPHSDPGGAVDKQVGEARRQDKGLLLGFVVVRSPLDRVGVDVTQHLGREPRQARLGVPHRGRWIVVDRAEVALAVDQHVAQRERLRHAGEGVVDRAVAVRVVLAHHLADDEGGLAVGTVGLQGEVVHRVEHPPVHRLQPVADVGQGAADDHAHRVVEIRRAHLVGQLALLDPPSGECFGALH